MSAANLPRETIGELIREIQDGRARLYVLRHALERGEIDCSSAEVVAGDVDNGLALCLDLLTKKP